MFRPAPLIVLVVGLLTPGGASAAVTATTQVSSTGADGGGAHHCELTRGTSRLASLGFAPRF